MRRALAFLTLLTVGSLHAGELNPPAGPIQPTGRFGPRVEITSLPITITESGSYYLGGNLTGVSGQSGIRISTDGVTIDLNGFSLIGVPGSFRGISVDQNVGSATIRNGTLTSWDAYGIYSADPGSNLFEDLHLIGNTFSGLSAGSHSVVRRCIARSNGYSGFDAGVATTVSDCTALQNGQYGFTANSSVIRNCTARVNGLHGFNVGNTIVTDCVSHQNTGDGIRCHSSSSITRNNCSSNGQNGDGAGIHVLSSGGTRVEGNDVSNNDRGVDVDQPGNLIIKNVAASNTTNYSIVAGNGVGPILSVGAVSSGTNPLSNYSL